MSADCPTCGGPGGLRRLVRVLREQAEAKAADEAKLSYTGRCALRAAETFVLAEAVGDGLVPVGGRQRARARDCALVLRHNGRGLGEHLEHWRVVGWRSSEAAGRELYDAQAQALRQGAVALWFGGEILATTSAPRLRSRW